MSGTIYIEKAGWDAQYDWDVYHGNRRLSSHYKKSAAKRNAVSEARQRNAVLKEQMTDGTWRTVRSYE
jgi:hypothetical protein